MTLSYRTTREILEHALPIAEGNKTVYDDLDDGVDNLSGFRSVLHGSTPTLIGYQNWPDELAGLGTLLQGWHDERKSSAQSATRRARSPRPDATARSGLRRSFVCLSY